MPEENFEFQSFDEEPERLDDQKLVPCPWCKKLIPKDESICYYCGKESTPSTRPLWIVWTAIIVIVIFVLFLLATV